MKRIEDLLVNAMLSQSQWGLILENLPDTAIEALAQTFILEDEIKIRYRLQALLGERIRYRGQNKRPQ